jgi:hypothetical protein
MLSTPGSQNLNPQPSGYEPDELPDRSTPRRTEEGFRLREGGAAGDGSLRPSSGPTQTGTTPRLAFRAVIGADGEETVELKVAL